MEREPLGGGVGSDATPSLEATRRSRGAESEMVRTMTIGRLATRPEIVLTRSVQRGFV